MTRPKILVVDDSLTALTLSRMTLGDTYEVLTASDGEAGVAVAKKERPDLILMDLVMPRLDGFGACRLLRAEESTREIPIIIVSTRGEPHNVEQGFAVGCNDFVTKPVSGAELLAKIRNHLRG